MSDSPSEVAWLLWNAILLLFTAVFIGCGVFFAWDVERARRPIRRRWICVVLLIASALPFLQRLPENDAPSTFAKEVFARFAIAAVPGLAVAALLIRRSKRRADGGGRVTST
jgi:glucose dehydrogenase